jgi:acylpyruvate hydrolase
MRLATLRLGGARTTAVRVRDDTLVEIDGFADVGTLLADPGWRRIAEDAAGTVRPLDRIAESAWAPVVPAPSKIVCLGQNYRHHILGLGKELPEHPTLFAKYADALIGPYDPIALPAYAAQAVDWEAELAVVVGAPVHRVDEDAAAEAIAGYSVINDVTLRDFQYRGLEWFPGKSFAGTAPFGPVLVTADEYRLGTELSTRIDGETLQSATTDDLVFTPAHLVSYVSQLFPLRPGDVIATGTPGGMGQTLDPPRYLRDGETLTTTIEGIGSTVNRFVVDPA